MTPKTALIIGGYGKMGRWLWPILRLSHIRIHIHSRTEQETPHRFFAALDDAVEEADLIFLATPIHATNALLTRVLEALKDRERSPIIIDLASVKTPLAPSFAQAKAQGAQLVSVHPLCGPDAAPKDAKILVMPVTTPAACAPVEALFQRAGAEIIRASLEDHDQLMALILGIPHLVNHVFLGALRRFPTASSLLAQTQGTSFRAQSLLATAVAQEDPGLYYHILADNPEIVPVVKALRAILDELLSQIMPDDASAGEAWFRAFMQDNRRYADGLGIDTAAARTYLVEAPRRRPR